MKETQLNPTIDNASSHPSLGALNSPYETDLSTIETHAEAPARFSRTHEDEGWPRYPGPPASARTQASAAERR